MAEGFYRQCSLRRVNGQIDMAWIPEPFAVRGKYLKIKIGDQWENGWKVEEVYARASADEVLARERDYLNQREVSDV